MWPSIDPGKLRHRITILRQVEREDTSGKTLNWEPFVTTYAAIGAQSASQNGQTVSEIIPIRINYQDGILQDMRIEMPGGRTYTIQRVVNVQELNAVLLLMAIELRYNNPVRFIGGS
jgi:head-tail adaptor